MTIYKTELAKWKTILGEAKQHSKTIDIAIRELNHLYVIYGRENDKIFFL